MGLFRRALLGYRTGEVDAAMAKRDASLAAGEARLRSARLQLAERDRVLASRDRTIEQRDARVEELDALASHLSRLVVQRERELGELRGRIDEVGAQARAYATRVRMQALRQAAAIAGNGNGRDAREHEAAAETVAEAPQSTFGVRPTAPPDLFEGLVQLEVGPLKDFSQLVGFEDAAGAIGGTREISVTRFSRGRATIDLRLDHPVELLRELEQRAPFDFKVTGLRDGRLILDLEAGAEVA